MGPALLSWYLICTLQGTMAVKRTHELIPFCHPLMVEGCKFDIYMRPRAEHEQVGHNT
jgi:molybdenum cofactor biosynthesis enzyme